MTLHAASRPEAALPSRDQSLRSDADTLNRLARDLTADVDLPTLLQRVTDAGTELTAAQFGAFFYNAINEQGEVYLLHTLSGAPREAFEGFGSPRKTDLFGPTFDGHGPIRIDDVLNDPRYGKSGPHHGMPAGHLPVRSYLAVPVIARNGEVLGGLFFGHAEVGAFDERAERMAVGVAAYAAVAIENARSYSAMRSELEARQSAEAALRASEQRYRELLQVMPLAMYTCEAPDGRITYYNEHAAALWGRRPAIGERGERFCGCYKVWLPDGTPVKREETPMALALTTGQQFRNLDVIVERPDGSKINVLVNIDPIRDAEGHIVGAVNVFQDVTGRKQADDARRESEVRFAQFMNHLPGLAWIKDGEGRYVFANAAAQSAFGVSGADLYGKKDEDIFPSEVAARFRDNDLAALRAGGAQIIETLEHEDGEVHYSIVNKFPIADLDGASALVGGMAIDITDRKRAEEALRESEQRFRLMADAAPVLIWVSDENKRGVYFNEGWLRFTGRTLEQELGDGWLENIHPEDLQRAAATCKEAFERGEPFQMEFRMRRADGEYRWVLDHAVPRFTKDGKLAGYVGSCVDVTDQKRAAEEVRSSEARLRMALEAGRMGTWSWSLDSNRITWSPGLEAIHGLAPGTFGGTFEEFQQEIHPDDRALVLDTIGKAVESGSDLKIEYRIVRSDGVLRWVEGKGKVLRGKNGKPARVTGVCADITERKQAELAHAYLAAIVESTQDAVISKTLEGRIISWNSGAERLFGYTAAEAIGQSVDFIIPEELRAEERMILAKLREGERIEHFETERIAKGNRRLAIALTISPIRDADGRLIGASKVARDITEKKRAEASLRHRFRQLHAIYQLSTAVSRAAAMDEIADAALDGLMATTGANRASILLFDDDGVMRFKGWRGLSEQYRKAVEGHSPWTHADVDAQPITVSDAERDESVAEYRETFRAEGIRAMAFIPLKSAQGVLGKFMVYYDQPHEFTEEELQICQMLAGHVAYAVERAAAERALRASEERYRAIIESQSEMVCRFRMDGTILFVNGAYARARNCRPDDLVGANFWNFVDAGDHSHVRSMLRRLTEQSPEVRIENQFVTSEGVCWTLWTNRALAFGPNGEPTELQSTGIDITERKRAEDALRESEARFRKMADAAPVLIWMSARAATRTWFSKPWLTFVGKDMESQLGTGWLESVHPDDRERCTNAYRESFEAGNPFTIEYRLRRHDGEYRWLLENATPITAVGEVCGFIASCIDITERKRAEAAQRESEERLRLALRGASAGVWMFDFVKNEAYWSDEFLALYGYDPSTPRNVEQWLRSVHENDRQRVVDHYAAMLESAESEFRQEFRILHPERGVRWIFDMGHIERDADGKALRCEGISIDITDRKRAEEAVAESEHRFRQMIESLPAAIYTTDAHGRVTHFNTAAVHFSGRVPELGSDHWCVTWKLYYPDGTPMPHEQCPMATALREGRPVRGMEAIAERPDGTRRWFEAFPTPLRDSDGRLIGAINMLVDVTDRKRDEKTLRIRTRQAETIAKLGEQALREHNVQRLFESATRMVAETLNVEFCKVLELLPGKDRLLLRAGVGWRDELVGEATVPTLIESQAGYTLHQGKPVIVDDLRTDTRFSGPPLLMEHGVISGISCVICGSDAQPWGVLGAHSTKRVAFTKDDVSFLLAVANTLGSAIDRERAELALRLSEQQFRKAIEDAPVPVILQTEDGEVLQISHAWTALTGYTLDDAHHFQPWLAEAYAAADLEVKDSEGNDNRVDAEMRGVEYTVTTRDGQRRNWLLSASSPGRLRDGRRYIVAMAQDITARKRIEHALRESEARFRNMADYAPVLIWVNDCDGCTFVNREYLHFIGRPFNEVRGMRWTQFVHPDDLPGYLAAFRKANETQKPYDADVRLRRADGKYRWMHTRALPRFAESGELVGFVGSSTDITDQIEARQALEEHGAVLERAVAQRTIELEESNQRLRLAERMASLGTLSAGLGHDIGNVLIPMRVRLESLTAAALPPDLQEHVDVIRTSTEYLQRLSSGLRMLASDAGRSGRVETTKVSEWWPDAQPMMATALPRGVKLITEIANDDIAIAVSRAALTQIVFNLVQNAGEATKNRQGGMVTVTLEPAGPVVRLRVSDNGQGMTEEVKRRCMEPFFTTKPRGMSTGLGLSLIHSLIHDAGGAIEIESELGAGTTFSITLPRVLPEHPTADGPPRLAVVHLKDVRLQAYVCAELRSMRYDVALGPGRMAEGELIIIDQTGDDPRLPVDAAVLVLQALDINASSEGSRATTSHRVMTAEPKPQAIRKAIRELAQNYVRTRSHPDETVSPIYER